MRRTVLVGASRADDSESFLAGATAHGLFVPAPDGAQALHLHGLPARRTCTHSGADPLSALTAGGGRSRAPHPGRRFTAG